MILKALLEGKYYSKIYQKFFMENLTYMLVIMLQKFLITCILNVTVVMDSRLGDQPVCFFARIINLA